MSTAELTTMFGQLIDEELIQRALSGDLIPQAQTLAEQETANRGLTLPARQTAPLGNTEYQGDLVMVARHLTATEAHMLSSCLNAAGVPAEAADTNFVQTHSLLMGAVGGASIRVPANFVDEAHQVIAAYQRGEFDLGENFDAGSAA